MTAALRKVSDEVFVACDPIVRLGADQVGFLKQQAASSSRRRARICAHRDNGDALHEMLIAVCSDSYIRPHKHARKSESFHIIEGSMDVVVLDDSGVIADVIALGDFSSGKPFFYRLADGLFHTLIVHGDVVVLHEVTNGPFIATAAQYAPFAPADEEQDLARAYMEQLERSANSHRLNQTTGHPS